MTASSTKRGDLSWEGESVPCLVRVVVFQAGHSAAAGLRCTDPPALARLLQNGDFATALPGMLDGEIRAEINWQGVTTGVIEEAIAEVVDTFVKAAVAGSPEVVSRRIAEGELPETGQGSRLEYALNPDHVALSHMADAERRRIRGRVHQVRAGQTLVMRSSAGDAKPGVTVRGEPINPGKSRRGQALSSVAGVGTEVRGERLVASLDGVCREDGRGRVRVVQELEVEHVSRATGDLPRSGVAAVNVLIRKGVSSGASVQSTEDVFVGTAAEPATLEAACRVGAGNLIVRGLIAGPGLPEPVITGEVESLEPAAQQQVRSELDASQVLASGILAAREIIGRSAAGSVVLVQEAARNAALESSGDMHIDGDLVGGVAVCGGMLAIGGDLGSSAGGLTRIRLGMETPQARRRVQLGEGLRAQRHLVQERLTALEEHGAVMTARARKSPYWASLMKDEKRPPARPLERRLLVQFLESARQRKRLEQDLYDAQEDVRGSVRELEILGADSDDSMHGVRVTVAGTAHAGVSLELVRAMTPEDGSRTVQNRMGEEVTLGSVRAELAEKVEHYLSLYEPGVEERRQALGEMFEGASHRPEGPTIPDRRFEVALGLGEAGDEPLRPEGSVYVRAHDPSTYYLLQRATVREAVQRPLISVEEEGGDLVFKCQPGEAGTARWQEDDEILASLEEIWVAGNSARQHLLSQ